MNSLKYILMTLIGIVFSINAVQGNEKPQYFFTHIIFDPLLRSLPSDEQLSSSLGGVLSGRDVKCITEAMVLRKIPGQDNQVEISFPAAKEVRLIAFIKEQSIEKIVRYDNGREDTFFRISIPVSASDVISNHVDFSNKQYLQFYHQEELKLFFDGDRMEIPLEIFSFQADGNRVEALLKLQTEDYFRAVKYQGNQLFSTEHLMKFDQRPWLRLVAHFYRFRDSWYLGDSYAFNSNKKGKYIEYYPDGIIKSYVESMNGQWGKQKIWFQDGRFDAEYPYPPGKPKIKVKSTLNPNWIQNMAEFKQWKLENSAYWDEKTLSPYYDGALQISNLQDFFPVSFYFSSNQTLLKQKFLALKKDLISTSTANTEISENQFTFQSSEKRAPSGICTIEPIAKVIPAAFIALAKAETGSDSTGYPTGSRSNLPGSILDDVDKIHSN